MEKEIIVFTGSSAEFGLLEPLIKKLQAKVLVSGSHLSPQFGFTYQYIKAHYTAETVEILVDGDSGVSVCKSMGLGLISLSDALVKLNPGIVIILGDRYEALACALSCYNLALLIAHIEGSDITLGSKDDGYRKCIDIVATLKFPVEEYGSLGCIFPEFLASAISDSIIVAYRAHKGDYKKEFGELMDVVKELPNVSFMLAGADEGGRWLNQYIKNAGFEPKISSRQNYISMLAKAAFIIGNSSSGLIEAPSLNIPSINVGDRQKGRAKASSVIDCVGQGEEILKAIKKAKQVEFPVFNPYYKADTLDRISEKIKASISARMV